MSNSFLSSAKISVIIPIYKVERYLHQCLDSIVNQTYRNLEIILVDDGSPDNCGVICDEYAAGDSRIVVVHKENGGLCAARNDGLAKATGDWIAFVDSDDWCELDYFEQYMKVCEAVGHTSDVLLSRGRFLEYPQKQHVQVWFPEPFHYTERKQIESLMPNIQVYGLPWDKLYNASFLKENRLQFDASCRALEDLLFNFQVFDHAMDVIGCTFVGYHNRVVTGSSITGGYNPNKFQVTYHTVCTLSDYVQHRNITGESTCAVEVLAMLAVSHSLRCCYFHPANSKPYVQTANNIKAMKKEPLIHKAIYSPNNHYLSHQQIVLKYAMRLSWVWPLKLLHMGKKLLLPN